jgi:hypothetical protein
MLPLRRDEVLRTSTVRGLWTSGRVEQRKTIYNNDLQQDARRGSRESVRTADVRLVRRHASASLNLRSANGLL